MSSTDIYIFHSNGEPERYARIWNSWRGAHKIWRLLEEKYLPSLPKPLGREKYYSRLYSDGELRSGKEDEIWKLANKESPLSDVERIVLLSTMDWAICKIEDIPKLIDAYRTFDGDTSLPEQADILEKILTETDVIAIGFNQTSVAEGWYGRGYTDDEEERVPYNILKENRHFYLFEDEIEVV
jgi:hypothetical protein